MHVLEKFISNSQAVVYKAFAIHSMNQRLSLLTVDKMKLGILTNEIMQQERQQSEYRIASNCSLLFFFQN